MDERGLWELFFATGLPAAYMAVAGRRQEEESRRENENKARWKEPVKTAFQTKIQEV